MSDIIKLPKRFDYSANSEFSSAIAAALSAESKAILLDCAGLEYIDSAGIGMLVMAHKKAISNRSSISMINAKASVKEILLLANLQKLMEIK
jgi:anti-anti-sigma factor